MPKKYSDEVRAQCMAALLAGQGVSQLSEEMNIPRSTLQRWQRYVAKYYGEGTRQRKADYMAGLISTYFEESLTTLIEQLRKTRSENWITKQSASELGVFHGILFDKIVRILEAIEGALEEESTNTPDNVVTLPRTTDGSSPQ
jgi:transposase-like protein